MKWIKKSFATTIEELLEEELGAPLSEIDDVSKNVIPSIKTLAKRLNEISLENKSIYIIGDYDADGITSSVGLSLILDELNIDYKVYIPKRFTDGYGINPSIVEKVKESDADILLTVDNGTTAKDVLDGFSGEKLIIDHHLPSDDKLPENALIVNPHLEDIPFKDFCAAGLVYKLAQALKNDISKKTLDYVHILATIGTIADVMPLIDENRATVKSGLKLLKKKDYSNFMGELLNLIPDDFTAKDVAFQIAPLINASGRLYDKGGQMVYNTLYQTFTDEQVSLEALTKNNTERKNLQEDYYRKADEMYDKVSSPIILHIPDCPEGLVGIIAGRMSENYHRPSFIFTDAKEDGILKGSARAGSEDFHVKEFLDLHKDLFIRYGGHKGAAGFSIEKDKFEDFKKVAKKDDTEPVLYYDLEIDNPTPENITSLVKELSKYEPFGEGFRAPIFKTTLPISITKTIGANGMKMIADNGLEILSFRERDAFKDVKTLSLVGSISLNTFMGETKPQMEIIDYHIDETKESDYVPLFLQ